jgi:septal ring factor EnvC (AmiA/AmiB activator)
MKFLLMSLLVFSVYSNADELQRIESIVSDIKKLRIDYDKSEEELSLTLIKLKDEKEKNKILIEELNKAENRVNSLENKIKNLKKPKKSNSIKKVIIKEKIEICSKNQIVDNNKFPQLKMRDKDMSNTIVDTTPQTYRLNKNAKIYDSKDGNIIEEWEDKTSFTSSLKSGNWIKITGYFVEKVWRKSNKELWIEERDVQRR